MNDRTAPRPTLRCLSKDLKLAPAPVDEPLDEIEHELLDKVREQYADVGNQHERILAVKDPVLWKAKVGRWRGAVWIDKNPDAEVSTWLIAAGNREEGSPDDFYRDMEGAAKTGTVRSLLPTEEDHHRYRAEAAERLRRQLVSTVHRLCRACLLNEGEQTGTVGGAAISIDVRKNDDHETYVGIRVVGPVPMEVTAVILHNVPGCDPRQWDVDVSMPERPSLPAEVVWLNLMDPDEALKQLGDEG